MLRFQLGRSRSNRRRPVRAVPNLSDADERTSIQVHAPVPNRATILVATCSSTHRLSIHASCGSPSRGLVKQRTYGFRRGLVVTNRTQRSVGTRRTMQFVATTRPFSPLLRRRNRRRSVPKDLVRTSASVDVLLYEASRSADALVTGQLGTIGPWTFMAAWAAGLLTSCSPCTLSVLPLTIGYIAGHAEGAQEGSGSNKDASVATDALAFALGLATTMACMGVFAAEMGKTYGQVGEGLPVLVSLLAVVMGLNLLEVLPMQLPSIGSDWDIKKASLPPLAKSYAAGLVFALAASPCSTPVLATLLGYVATSQEPVTGGALLMSYSTGYVSPLLAAASATGALKKIMELRKFSGWITPASGFLLLSGGTYSLLTRLVG